MERASIHLAAPWCIESAQSNLHDRCRTATCAAAPSDGRTETLAPASAATTPCRAVSRASTAPVPHTALPVPPRVGRGEPPAGGLPAPIDSRNELRLTGQRHGPGAGQLARRVDDPVVGWWDAEDAHQRRRVLGAVRNADVGRRPGLADRRGERVPERPVALLPAGGEEPVRAVGIRGARVRRVLELYGDVRVEAEAAEDASLGRRAEGGLRLRVGREDEVDRQAAEERRA